MATSPAFISTAVIGSVSLSSANTALDGSGTITTIVTGASTGTRILEADAKIAATGTSTICLVNFFLSIDSGTTWRLFDSIQVAAATQSTSVATAKNLVTWSNLWLKDSTHRLGCTTTISQAINVFAFGGDA